MLGLGMAAQGASYAFILGLPFLLPTFQDELGLSLPMAGLLIGAPAAGMLTTLIAWGWVADRFGERLAITAGLGLAAAILACAALTNDPLILGLLLALAGAAGASANAASGRVVLGWFPPDKRGLAMGLRQTAQPLGVAVAGVIFPQVGTIQGALLAMAALCLVTAIAEALFLVDPPRKEPAPGERTGSPYRTPRLWRVHGASVLLVVPQFATASFALLYLVSARNWDPAPAGQLVAAAQLGGAAGRLLCGRWSDLVASRLTPMRRLAVVNAAVMFLLALAVQTRFGPALMIAGVIVSMSGNGLAFTAVSELAGSAWAGRAMGVHNTLQHIVLAGTPAALGALISGQGYGIAFALAGAFALTAAFTTPRDRSPLPAEAA
jgi:sugar phosphate permease